MRKIDPKVDFLTVLLKTNWLRCKPRPIRRLENDNCEIRSIHFG